MKTSWAKAEVNTKKWFIIDANGKVLGRLASNVAKVLMGKNKPIYTPFIDTGDFVVIINAEKIFVTGKKMEDKIYYSHSGYLGGLKSRTLKEYIDKKPEDVIMLSVRRMLPKTKMGRKMLKKLKIYSGSDHPHSAQKPVELEL